MLEVKYMLVKGAGISAGSSPQFIHQEDKSGASFNLLLCPEIVPQLMAGVRILLT